MAEFKGIYGPWEILIAILTSVWLAMVDTLYFTEIFITKKITSEIIFSATLINLMVLFILLLPVIRAQVEKISSISINDFLQLPSNKERLTFPVISTFLGEQALGAFLGTVLIYTTRHAVPNIGVTISAVYCFLLLLISIAIISLSLLRFVSYFAKHNWPHYAFASFISTTIMFSFFALGIKLAG